MATVIAVRFKNAGKLYYFDPDGLDIETGSFVIVETARGVECGEVAFGNREIEDEKIMHPLKKVMRAATDEDPAAQQALIT